MRVATRRMRAAFQVFDPYYKDKAIKPHIKGLRRTGQALGAVRDLDVLLEKARAFGGVARRGSHDDSAADLSLGSGAWVARREFGLPGKRRLSWVQARFERFSPRRERARWMFRRASRPRTWCAMLRRRSILKGTRRCGRTIPCRRMPLTTYHCAAH